MRLEIMASSTAEILKELRNWLYDNNEREAADAVAHVARLRNFDLHPQQPSAQALETLIEQARDQLGDRAVLDILGWHGGTRLQDIALTHWAFVEAELRGAMSLPRGGAAIAAE